MNPQAWDFIAELLPYAIVPTVALIMLFLVQKIWKHVVTGRVRHGEEAGMSMQDIDKMSGQGVITEAEKKKIREAMARRVLEGTREQQAAERERAIMLEAQVDPDAVRKLLDAEKIQAAEAQPGRKPEPEPKPSPPAGRKPPEPSMNNPRVVRARNEARAQEKQGSPSAGELDILLKKGAISREEYDRLKQFFK